MAYLKKIAQEKDNAGPSFNEINQGRVEESTIEAGMGVSEKKKKILIGSVVIAILVVLGVSLYSFWSWNRGGVELAPEAAEEGTANKIDQAKANEIIAKELDPTINAGEKTEASPINGVLYTKDRADFWKKRRPMAVVIENHIASRPPYGLADAEIVFEAVAEGGITRFVAVFLANQTARLEPIRSAREYFLHWSSEFDALFVHHGGASSDDASTDALGNIEKYGIDNLDCITGDNLCTRDESREAPHNSMSNTPYLWERASEKGINDSVSFASWKFKEDLVETERPLSQNISYNFWDYPDYLVRWEYDPQTNLYKRTNGGLITDIHLDANYNQQLAAKNIIVQKMGQKVVDDGTPHPHLVFDTIGTGDAVIFLDGKKIEATWEKTDRTSRTMYYDAITGEELEFNRGQIWVSVVPVENLIQVTN